MVTATSLPIILVISAVAQLCLASPLDKVKRSIQIKAVNTTLTL